MKKLFIIDYMNIVSRSHWAFDKYDLRSDAGLPTGAIYGTCSFIFNLFKEHSPDYMVAAKESPSKESWRKDLYADYKSNRGEKPENMVQQFPEIDKFFGLLGVPLISIEKNEADDVVGSLVHQLGDQVEIVIVSSDKDFMQLIGPNVKQYIPKNGGEHIIAGAEEVLKKFSCTPDKVRDVLAIMGDSVDCVPGVKGIGPKGASQLVEEYGSIGGVFKNVGVIKASHAVKLRTHREMALLSYKLVGLNKKLDLGVTLEEMVCSTPVAKKVYDFLISHDMNSLASNYFDQVYLK